MTTKSMTNVDNNVQTPSLNYSQQQHHHHQIHQNYLLHPHTSINHPHTMSIRAKHFTIDSLISNKETGNGTKRAALVDDILMENSGEHKHRNHVFHHSQQPSFNGHHHWNNDPMLANNLLNNRSMGSRKRSLDIDKYRNNKSLKSSAKHRNKLENDTNNSDDDTNNNDEDEEINVDDIVDIESTGSSHDDECVSCKSDPGSDHQPISPNTMAASAAAYHAYDPLLSGKTNYFRL